MWTYEKHNVAYTKRAQKCNYVLLQADDLLVEFLAQPPSCLDSEVACIVFDSDDVSAKSSPSPAAWESERNLTLAAVRSAVYLAIYGGYWNKAQIT